MYVWERAKLISWLTREEICECMYVCVEENLAEGEEEEEAGEDEAGAGSSSGGK